VSGHHDVDSSVSSTLYLGSRVTGSTKDYGLNGQLADQPLQYAVQADTRWISRYTGMDFLQFARCGQDLFAVRTDGIYRVDGPAAETDCRVDFGASMYGLNLAKQVSDLYLGCDTDGEITATADSDGRQRTYMAVRKGHLWRSRWGKGVRARVWGVEVDISGATYLHLDSAELTVQASNRYWVRS